jgi:hypothetical protein
MALEVVVEHLNQLGIVAEVCRAIEVAEWLNAQDPTSRQRVSGAWRPWLWCSMAWA